MASHIPSAHGITTAPANVAAIPGNTQATVSWDPVAGASGYNITVSDKPGGPGLSLSGYQSGPSYTVTGLTNGTTYYFRLQASSATSGYSAYSAEVSTTPSVSLPLAPVGVNIASEIGQLSLVWTAVDGATEYRIYRRSAGEDTALVGASFSHKRRLCGRFHNGYRLYDSSGGTDGALG